MNHVITIPPDTMKDLIFIWKVRNHPKVRVMMRNTKSFTLKEHMRFWKREKQQWFLWRVIWFKGKRVGYCSLRNGELGIAILPEYWSRGIGFEAIRQFKGDMRKLGLWRSPKAEIKKGNTRSIALFKKAKIRTKIIEKKERLAMPRKFGKSAKRDCQMRRTRGEKK